MNLFSIFPGMRCIVGTLQGAAIFILKNVTFLRFLLLSFIICYCRRHGLEPEMYSPKRERRVNHTSLPRKYSVSIMAPKLITIHWIRTDFQQD